MAYLYLNANFMLRTRVFIGEEANVRSRLFKGDKWLWGDVQTIARGNSRLK
jgi:hypothetical protein